MAAKVEVIVLDDSSDASSGSETWRASASTTPPTSPAPRRRRAQSIGYNDAVKAALAMAAAFTVEKPPSSAAEKKKKAAPAPPLLATKTKKKAKKQPASSDKRSLQSKSREKDRGTNSHKIVHRRNTTEKRRSAGSLPPTRRSGSFSSDSGSSSDSSLNSDSRRTSKHSRFIHRPSSASRGNARPITKGRRRSKSDKNSRQEGGMPTQNKQPAEVVDLLSSSSSSSSDSSGGRRSRLSMASMSSLTSSDSESLPGTNAQSGKNRLVLNDRVQMGNKPCPSIKAGQRGKTTSGQDTTESAAGRPGKRKRVQPQMRRESPSVNNGGKTQAEQLTKKKTKKPAPISLQARRAWPKPATATRSDPLSLLSSSPSSSAVSSSPDSSPRATPPRKSAAEISASRAHGWEGEMDAFGRYRCRKSVSGSVGTPTRNVSPVSPMSASAIATKPAPSPASSTSPSPRKKRRVVSDFNIDHMALDNLQAQERELAWIRSQHKQARNLSRPSKAADQKDNVRHEVIDVDSHVSVCGVTHSKKGGAHHERKKVEIKSSGADGPVPVISRTEILHPTSYRGVFFDKAPPNLLSIRDHVCSAPFESDCDHPLTFYDETDTLISHCAILESFGKPTQCISSVFPVEVAKSQSDVTLSVSSLVTAHLPIIRRCHQRKVQAILSEARQKVSAYQAALRKHRKVRRELTPHILPRSSAEKHAAKQLKTTLQHVCDAGVGDVSFQIGRGENHVREKTLSSLVQMNRSVSVRPLRKYTTSVGLRLNYRVDDDPILRYTATTRPSGADSGVGELSKKKYGLRIGSVADEEVVEYVLRLVVGRLGDSEQVFHALKSELDFSQAYTAYSELTKLHDSRQRANARLDHVEKLGHDGVHTGDADIAALVNLMEQSSLSKGARARSLSRRLLPPIRSLESSIMDGLVDSASAGMAALGLRATDSYNELVDVYCGSFCRMCYTYNCHDHGGDHPLPARRVDPAYPPVRVAPLAACSDDSVGDKTHVSVRGSSSDEDEVVYLGRETNKTKPMVDPSEYVDASHVPLVTRKMRSFLSTSTVCSKLCWKTGAVKAMKEDDGNGIPAVALGVLRKLRETMGDNSCLLAAVVGSVSCEEVHQWIEKENASGEFGMTNRRTRNWKRGRRSGGSNHELVQRTRNQRLQDRGTANHEYEPCMHEGMCDSTGCSCMKRDHMCEKACACSRDCPNRFEGCMCSPGECRTSRCPCFAALRECNPDVCVGCGANELAVYSTVADDVMCARTTCGNMNVTRRKHKRLGMSFSSIHGYGMFALEPILASEFVYEYNGAVLSQDEAERRGLIYDKMEMSYLFDLNEDAVLDALRDGNKSKFINHEGEAPNCTAKVVSVSGVHHITIWAVCDIAVGEELVFDYGYKRNVGPDWSQRREVSKDTI
ncbi:hypothetical protein DVH05_003549 [Phytophthora capsici]|nr:hypothetical protein DVH05_003549 [Phytophthora capsici]